ncbi:YihY/virulence factor BrkB family protein [Enterococcus sp. LJL98]
MLTFLKREKVQRFFETVKTRVTDSEMTQGSIIIAYYLLLSLFPLLIAVGNLLPFLKIDPNSVLPYVQEVIPQPIYEFLGPGIQEMLTQGSGGLLSFSAVLTLWSASASMNALQIALNRAYGVASRGNFIIVRMVSLIAMLVLLFSIVGVTLVVGSGKLILEKLQPIFLFSDQIISTFQTLKWPLTFLILFTLMTVIYSIIPNVRLHARSIFPGAFFATIGWMFLSQAFGIYAKYFTSRISGYQIIGSFIVMMLWLNFAAIIIILGGIINAVTEEMIGGTVEEREGPMNFLTQRIKDNWKN